MRGIAGVPAMAASWKIAGASNDATEQAAEIAAAASGGITCAAASARASAASNASIARTNAAPDQISAIRGATNNSSPRCIAVSSRAVCQGRAGVQIAQRLKLGAARRWRLLHCVREPDRPASRFGDLLACDALV